MVSEEHKVQGTGSLVSECVAGNGIRGGSGLLDDPLDDIVSDTATVVLGIFAVTIK